MQRVLTIAVFALVLSFPMANGHAAPAKAMAPTSTSTDECVACHEMTHPGMVESWKKSRHAQTTPTEAMQKQGLELKVSNPDVPEALRETSVGCAECHLLRPDKHADTFDHNGYEVHMVVSPDDCATCHKTEAEQYEKNIMSKAYGNLADNPVYSDLARSINGVPHYKDGKVAVSAPSAATEAESCYYCHGTKLSVTGAESRDTDLGPMDFPVVEGWPNQGSGRVNLDGSLGSCSACHVRHRFSIEMARKPHTCKECHDGPDVPAYKVYAASKHGNMYSTHKKEWNWTNVPWTVGRDFTAPTCATCHVSLVVNTMGDVVAERTHEMANRLPWRIFGLPYAHPQPKSPVTSTIVNKDGLPLPTALDGTPASEYLIDEAEMAKRQAAMQATCRSCHDSSWVDGHWARFENTIQEANQATLAGTGILLTVYAKGLATGPGEALGGGSLFDEHIEKVWSDLWLLQANTVRFASAMAGGGDYGVFFDGRYYMHKRVMEMYNWLELKTTR